MADNRVGHWLWRRGILPAGAGLVLVGLATGGRADGPPVEALPAVAVAPAEAQVLDLAACRQLALERQPSLAAAQASLTTASIRAAGLQRLPNLPLLARDLPVRRQQACMGITAATAGLEQARWDTLYSVTRCYFAAVYARQQLDLADSATKELGDLKKQADQAKYKDESEQLAIFLEIIAGRRQAAEKGIPRALAALREAIGLEPSCPIQVADTRLPDLVPSVACQDMVAMALSRRGELVQAGINAQVSQCEVHAQSLNRFHPTVRTFASGSDIHARPIPAGDFGTEYQPAALAPEMPPFLAGDRPGRVGQAAALAARAQTLSDKTRGLIALEAEDACQRYQEALEKLPRLRTAAEMAKTRADRLAEESRDPTTEPRFSEAATAGTLAGQLRQEVNETQFQLLLNLAALERITAGGFAPGFPTSGTLQQ